jgi:hypothetical protein
MFSSTGRDFNRHLREVRKLSAARIYVAMAEFTHLHLHTEYSLLDGACDVKKLVDRVAALGQTVCRHDRPRKHLWSCALF